MVAQELDITEVLASAQDIADMIMASEEMKTYQYTKNRLAQDPEAQAKITEFQQLKEDYEEVQRFGKYHPDYEQVGKRVRELRREVLSFPSVYAYKKAETALDDLLYHVCRTIANGVSETVKVPSDNPLYNLGGSGCGTSGGCGTGGSCGCG